MINKLKKNYLLLIYTFLLIYFFLNFLGGDRGLMSYIEKKNLLQNLKAEENKLSQQIDYLEFKNSLLTTNLDLDYIETLIRQKFLFGRNGETIYITK